MTACPAALSVPDYERAADDATTARSLAGVTIGIPARYYYDAIDHEVAELLAASRAVLEKQGAKVVDVPIGDHGALNDLSNAILWPEAAGLHLQWLRERPQDYAQQTRARLLVGLGVPATLYVEAVRGRARLLEQILRETFAACDVLHVPVLKRPVPTAAETDVGGSAAMSQVLGQIVANTRPFNLLGLPGLSVPIGFTRNRLAASHATGREAVPGRFAVSCWCRIRSGIWSSRGTAATLAQYSGGSHCGRSGSPPGGSCRR